MITTMQFNAGIARLQDRHGDKSYQDIFVKLLWDVVKYLTDSQFDFVVRSVIGECRFEPTISKFKEFAALAKRTIKNPEQDFKTEIEYPPSIFDREETDLFFKTLKEIIAGKKTKEQGREMISYIEDRLTRANIKFQSVLGDK